jgi:hypothetical protein
MHARSVAGRLSPSATLFLLAWAAAPCWAQGAGAADAPSADAAKVAHEPLRADDRMLALVEAAALWVAAETGLAAPPVLPQLAALDAGTIDALRSDLALAATWPSEGTIAVYSTRTATIYLPPGWTGETAAEVSILVHEMVHHFQQASDQRFACPEAREEAAYAAQRAFLKQSGESLESAFDFDPMFLLLATRCVTP